MGGYYGVKISTKLLNYFELMFSKISSNQSLLFSEYFFFSLVNNICWLNESFGSKNRHFLLTKSVLTLDGSRIFFHFYSSLFSSFVFLLPCLNYTLARGLFKLECKLKMIRVQNTAVVSKARVIQVCCPNDCT